MQLRYGLLALTAEVNAGGKLAMMGGDITHFQVDTFPAVQPSVCVVVSLLVSPEECGKAHTYRLDTIDPSGKTLVRTKEGEFTAPPNGLDAKDDSEVGLIAVIEPFPLSLPGKYKIRIFVDDLEPIDVVRFYAVS